ncbi:MAG: Fic family protein [Candidatus Bilamarchaeaceae archaeon]
MMEWAGIEFEGLPTGLFIPTKESLLKIHDRVIEESLRTQNVGHYGVRDTAVLEYLLDRLAGHRYGENMAENVYYVGTELFFTMACRHPFTDGNKRTAFISSALVIVFNLAQLQARGYKGKIKDPGKMEWKEENRGPVIETIARWVEGVPSSELEKLIFNAGIMGKKRRELKEEDVKRFVNSFLKNNLVIERTHSPDVLRDIMKENRKTLEYLAKR